MILAYIAGPFTASTPELIEQNIRAAEAVAREIISRTDKVACLVPHSIGRTFTQGPGSPQYWYDATMRMLQACDVLVMVPGWEFSRGSIAEVNWCRANGMKVFLSVDEFVRWVDSWTPEGLELIQIGGAQ